MSRALCTLAAVAVMAPLLARADATTAPARVRVAVYGYPADLEYTVAGLFAEDAGAFAATDLSMSQLTDGVLAGFDCLVARLGSDPGHPEPTAAFEAIGRFVASGGCYVGDWWGAGAALTSIASGAWYPPSDVLGLFQGAVDGGRISTGWPVQLTVGHPVTDGLPQTFNLSNGSEYFARPVSSLDPRLHVIATTEGFDGTQPAILVGSTGRANAVLILFDAGDVAYADHLTSYWPLVGRLFRNAVRWAATTPVDGDAPQTTASLAGTEGKNGWWVRDVTVTLTATDGPYGSGVASTEYAIDGGTWQAYAGPFTISSDGTTHVSWRSTDAAGNVEDTRTLELHIDQTRPTIVVAAPAAGGAYALRQPVAASWSASDGVSGLATATATVANRDALDTETVGGKTFSIVAEDLAGNTATLDVAYAVHYVFGGWLKPLVADGTGVHKLQANIPVRFQLVDWSGLPAANAVAKLRVAKYTPLVVGTTEVDPVDTGTPSADDYFQWDANAQAYVYKLSPKAKGLSVGTWELQAVLIDDDEATYTLTIGLR